jgi:nuclear factor of activated T-cells 5
MVFRCLLPETGEVLQVVSDPILCTQPLGSPEIYKISLRESDIKGGQELFLIGKNFHKDSKVIFESGNHWRKVVNPQKEFLNSTHLVCQIPSYDGIDGKFLSMINIDISVHCNHKTSDPIKFIYTNSFDSNRKL